MLVPGIVAHAIVLAAALIPSGDAVSSSDLCGICHRDIYRMWKSSVHASSLENLAFLTTFREAEIAGEGDAVRLCLNCHAPMVEYTRDLQLREKVTWEGVNCEFCHSVTAVDMSGFGPRYKLDLGGPKRGPIRNAASIGHEVAYSALHQEAVFCAPCHQFVNAEGVPVMNTYGEWLESSAAKRGTTCQHCHMNATLGDVVDPRLKRSPEAVVNLHEMPGGRSLEQLHKAIRVAVRPSRDGDLLRVVVELSNRGAGHAVPTGMPSRRIVMRITVEAGDAVVHEERTFGRDFTTKTGVPITRDIDYFSAGVKAGADNRIQADETRSVTVDFPVPRTETANLTVKLHYEHAPEPGDEDRTWLTFYSHSRKIRGQKP